MYEIWIFSAKNARRRITTCDTISGLSESHFLRRIFRSWEEVTLEKKHFSSNGRHFLTDGLFFFSFLSYKKDERERSSSGKNIVKTKKAFCSSLAPGPTKIDYAGIVSALFSSPDFPFDVYP